MKNWLWPVIGVIATAYACSAVPETPDSRVGGGSCVDVSGTYKALGSTDWIGPFKNYTATIFYVLRREAPPGATDFTVSVASGKLSFSAVGGSRESDRFDIEVSCVASRWTSNYKFSNYSDGATSRVTGKDTFTVDGAGALVVVSKISGGTTAILTRQFDATTTTTFAGKR